MCTGGWQLDPRQLLYGKLKWNNHGLRGKRKCFTGSLKHNFKKQTNRRPLGSSSWQAAIMNTAFLSKQRHQANQSQTGKYLSDSCGPWQLKHISCARSLAGTVGPLKVFLATWSSRFQCCFSKEQQPHAPPLTTVCLAGHMEAGSSSHSSFR